MGKHVATSTPILKGIRVSMTWADGSTTYQDFFTCNYGTPYGTLEQARQYADHRLDAGDWKAIAYTKLYVNAGQRVRPASLSEGR